MSARLLTYLRRDPRQILLFVMPVLFVALFALQSRGITIVIWQGLIWGGWMMQMTAFPWPSLAGVERLPGHRFHLVEPRL